jgi:hypothetical protein
LVQVFISVLVLVVLLWHVKAKVRAVVFVVVIGRQLFRNGVVAAKADSSLVGPASRDVLDCVASASQDHHGDPPALDSFEALSMPFSRQAERTQPVIAQRVRSTLDHYGLRLEVRFDSIRHILKEFIELRILDPRFQRHIH